MTAFVQGASMRWGAPVHVLVREDGMDSVTACGRRLFYANHIDYAEVQDLCRRCVESTDPEQHGYGVDSDCICGRNFSTVRGLREHLTKQRPKATDSESRR